MDERCGNSVCRGELKCVSDSSKVMNEKKRNLETDEMWSNKADWENRWEDMNI